MTTKHKQFISAVVYTHNYELTISEFLQNLYKTLCTNFEKFEIICVNDASTDGTRDAIQNAVDHIEGGMISVVNLGFYQGLESAMLAGIDLAIGDFVFELDDITAAYIPELIIPCYERCLQGFDIVSCGKRSTRTSSKIFYKLYNHYSGAQYAIKDETFRIVSRRAINRIYSISPNPIYRKALYRNCGLKSDYFIHNGDLVGSNRKQLLKNPHDTAISSLILFTDVAYKASLIFTLVMMLTTLGTLAYTVVTYLLGNPAEGYTTMMILISGAFWGVFVIFTVIIKYLSLILKFIFQRQRYVIESIEKLIG